MEVSIADIHGDLKAGKYTIVELTQFYLDRIDSLDKSGPALNSVLTVNPDALEIAKELDGEMENGKWRGPLHGIPVLLKDNIDTGDKMPTTAGARLMANSIAAEDSPLAAQLREAGAVILGKANLSEWANFHSSQSSSGWSGLGGQTKNPYLLTHNPCGSSAGSGAAVAANLCVVAIGTETNGSIICPSNNNGIVGIKPTVGLISRTGIVPISAYQDTGGPMARSVRDAATVLGFLTATDDRDPRTLEPGRQAFDDYTPYLKAGSLEGKRIGYYSKPLEEDSTALGDVMDEAIQWFKNQGAEVVTIPEILPEGTGDASFMVLLYEFKDGLNRYLAGLGGQAPAKDLAEIIALTLADSVEMEYHDHALLQMAQEKGGLDEPEYQDALAQIMRAARQDGIDRVMDENTLDAIIAPSGSPAWVTSLENGDTFGVFSSSPAAIAGYPSITVPMGQLEGLPVGLSIFGRAWSEAVLIELAYAFEQGTKHRFSPEFRAE